MVNYGKGKIYRIVNTENETVYIGSTCQTLSQRFTRHEYKGNGNKIILIENYACNCREELLMREQQVIEEYSNLLNQVRAYCSPEQRKERDKKYREANREYFKEYCKERYQANKDKIKEQIKEYREANKDKRKEQTKKYREANKDKINAKKKEYYQANKEKIREKVQCEFCDSLVCKDGLKSHQETKKCLKAQNKL